MLPDFGVGRLQEMGLEKGWGDQCRKCLRYDSFVVGDPSST